MQLLSFPYGIFQANMYVLVFGHEVIVIDPCVSWDKTDLSDVTVKAVLCTHGHFDHIDQADSICSKFACPIWVSEADLPMLSSAETNHGAGFGLDIHVSADTVAFQKEKYSSTDFGLSGEEKFSLSVIPTPGHTDGSVCLLFRLPETGRQIMFTGDMLFAGSVGRTDLGGDEASMLRSISLLKNMDDQIECYPGHGPNTILGREKLSNPYFLHF